MVVLISVGHPYQGCRYSILEEASAMLGRFGKIEPVEEANLADSFAKRSESNYLMLFGSASLSLISIEPLLDNITALVLVEPEFTKSLALSLHRIDSPCLIVSRKGIDDPVYRNALRFHDRIAGSQLRAVLKSDVCSKSYVQALRECFQFLSEQYDRKKAETSDSVQ
ncbi:hypothetical protein ApAK_08585 [Thermoplasmatales archaeon AK]|nr:hypothetical protein [Thermoplasmatales archaeon AK]